MEYNTTRTDLILREYGRNFHKLVDHINGIKEVYGRENYPEKEPKRERSVLDEHRYHLDEIYEYKASRRGYL